MYAYTKSKLCTYILQLYIQKILFLKIIIKIMFKGNNCKNIFNENFNIL